MLSVSVSTSPSIPSPYHRQENADPQTTAVVLRQYAVGHDARIIDPGLVAPYRQRGCTGKNDDNDAAAICEAAGRPRMRFIPVKMPDQQAVLLVHRLRASCVAEHTRTVNQLRGFLAEFGIVAPKGVSAFKAQWPRIRQQHDADLPPLA